MLSPGARFCHRCGAAAPGGPDRRTRVAWIGAGTVVVAATILGIRLGRQTPAPRAAIPPPAGADAPAFSGRAPDISALSPRQRFDRLSERVLAAAEAGDTTTMRAFTAHALSAYTQLDRVDADARFHAAILYAQARDFGPALALADSILAAHPGHLLGLLAQGTIAELRRDSTLLRRSREAFLQAWGPEQERPRAEYREHQTELDAFRRAALDTGVTPSGP
jgi:hypothetical protein